VQKHIVKQYVNQIIYWLRIFLVTGFHFLQSNDMHILFHVQNTYMFSDCRFRIKYLSSLIISFWRSLKKIEWRTCMWFRIVFIRNRNLKDYWKVLLVRRELCPLPLLGTCGPRPPTKFSGFQIKDHWHPCQTSNGYYVPW